QRIDLMQSIMAWLMVTMCLVLAAEIASADTFTYRDEQGGEQTVEARLLGSGQGAHALLKADGQVLLVSQGAVEKRETADGPPPLASAAMVDVLQQRFGADLLRTHTDKEFVIAFVAAGPLDRRGETRVKGFLQKTTRFMNNVN